MNVIEIKDENEFESAVLKSDEPVLVDFNADWCGPCQMVKPILDRLSNEHKIVSVNTDKVDSLAYKYGVMSIPCLVLIKNGEEVNRMIGYHSEDEIKEFLR